jgi:hypothetical protein
MTDARANVRNALECATDSPSLEPVMPRRRQPTFLPYSEDAENMHPVESAPPEVHRLFELARARRITIVRLCALAGVHHDVVGRWRRGETEPTFRVMRKLMDVLNDLPEQATA